MLLGERLALLRKKKKLTQQDVADKLHISRATYAQYEIDRRVPEYLTLEKMADFFEVSIDYLVGRKLYVESSKDQNDHIIKELVDKYNIDLSIEGTRDKLEQIVKLVFEQEDKKRQH